MKMRGVREGRAQRSTKRPDRPAQHAKQADDVCHALSPKFGPYGGQFVPETLMPALAELEAAYRGAGGCRVRRGARRAAAHLRGPADAADACAAADRAAGRRADLPEARRPGPHRRAQDQQRAGPGAAGPAHGQAAHRRRDRRGPARRRDGHGRGAARVWNASSTWARWILPASSPTCCACACWAPRCARWRAAAAR